MACNLADIIAVVSRSYNMTREQLLERTRRPQIARPRQIVMWIARHATKMSLPDVGNRLGGFDHTTVMYGVRLIERMMEEDPEFKKHVHLLAQQADARAAGRFNPLLADQNSDVQPAAA